MDGCMDARAGGRVGGRVCKRAWSIRAAKMRGYQRGVMPSGQVGVETNAIQNIPTRRTDSCLKTRVKTNWVSEVKVKLVPEVLVYQRSDPSLLA